MKAKVAAIAAHGVTCFVNRQLIYNYPENLLAEYGIMSIEHADFEGVERLALVTGGDITSTFDAPDKVKIGRCEVIEEIMIGEDKVCSTTFTCTSFELMTSSSNSLVSPLEKHVQSSYEVELPKWSRKQRGLYTMPCLFYRRQSRRQGSLWEEDAQKWQCPTRSMRQLEPSRERRHWQLKLSPGLSDR
jgi:hypothetical protein